MGKKTRTAIEPTREADYPEWYQQVIRAADLAEASPVRGCMVIKPWGYSLWENIQQVLDKMFKDTGHQNAYFPLFIPMRFMEKEAQHVVGFAKECAVVTHHRLVADAERRLKPAGPLDEPLIVRPTSETIIGEMFAKWIQSYRDLPLLINQWANVVRWEMRTRLFLRTTEFLWQEGHTAHATEAEAQEETIQMLNIYAEFAEDFMAMPVIKGEKTESERFPGALRTYCIEAMMQDRKALQAGTSHFLGQNFAKAADIQFLDQNGQQAFAWTTSWGVSTRLIGAMIMAHSDDDGLVLPPKLAPQQVVILPVIHDEAQRGEILDYCRQLRKELGACSFAGKPVAAIIDERDMRGGEKMWSWIKKGVPVRVEVGARELAAGGVFVGRRDREHRDRVNMTKTEFVGQISVMLDDIQQTIFERARQYREQHTVTIDSRKDFYDFFTPQNAERPEIHGGFALAHWNGKTDVEAKIKEDLGVTIRCIPLDGEAEAGRCIITGEPSARRVVFAKSY